MPSITVNLSDTFDEWRTKNNNLGTLVFGVGANAGDLSGLTTTDKSSLVAAINEVVATDSDDMENLIEDVTPQLGGHLDLNNKNITGTGNISATGTIAATGTITALGGFIGAINIVSDTSPSLGGDLDLNSNDIIGTGNISATGILTVTTIAGTQLGGDLDLNSNDITGTGNISATGILTVTTIAGTQLGGNLDLNSNGIIGSGSIAGTITGTTQSPSDNSTKLATTAYVDAQVSTENTLEEMNDTTITTPSNGQQLVYNSATSKWENTTSVSSGATEGFAVAVAIALG